eukprot:2906867-Pleurochrysis_carterae.AAC.1
MASASRRPRGDSDSLQRHANSLPDEQPSNQQLEADCRKLREELGKAYARVRVLEGAKDRLEHARAEVAEHSRHKADAAEQRTVTKRLEQKLEDLAKHLEAATEQLAASDASHQREVASLKKDADAARAAKEQLEQRLSELGEGPSRGGRARSHAGRAQLKAKWDHFPSARARRAA